MGSSIIVDVYYCQNIESNLSNILVDDSYNLCPVWHFMILLPTNSEWNFALKSDKYFCSGLFNRIAHIPGPVEDLRNVLYRGIVNSN